MPNNGTTYHNSVLAFVDSHKCSGDQERGGNLLWQRDDEDYAASLAGAAGALPEVPVSVP